MPCLAKGSEKEGRKVSKKNQRCCGVGRILRHEKGFENTAVKAGVGVCQWEAPVPATLEVGQGCRCESERTCQSASCPEA